MKILQHLLRATFCLLPCVALVHADAAVATGSDAVADRMLRAQTASGGWPKHLAGAAISYDRAFNEAEERALAQPDRADDATIDNDATTREIRHLAAAWQQGGDNRYRDAALRGVDYLLAAQYANGGWPQFHPDHSTYRGQVTFNDNAMTQVVELLQDIAEGRGALQGLMDLRGDAAAQAVTRAIRLILDLQVKINDVPTIWAAQYDEVRLVPATARSYELPSLSTSESVGIVRLLMRQPPTPRIAASIEHAGAWFAAHAIADTAVERIGEPRKRPTDVRLVRQQGHAIWARFYDLTNQQPLLVDRGGTIVSSLAALSQERRTGYAWYGTWAESLLQRDIPQWRQRHAADLAGFAGEKP